MTSKNILQEYFQKNNLELPKYKTQRLGGSDHQPVFVSEVTLYDGRVFSGEKEQNKKAAELSAAQKVLNEIDFKPPKRSVSSFNLKRKVGIFIDLENKPSIVEEINNSIDINVDMFVFASRDHPSLLKLKQTETNCIIVEVPSTRRDGADIGLIMSVGGFLFREDYEDFIIVTNDHYGDALVDCVSNIDKMFSWNSNPPRIYCCRTFDRVLETFQKLETN
jgi:hypothetical protein